MPRRLQTSLAASDREPSLKQVLARTWLAHEGMPTTVLRNSLRSPTRARSLCARPTKQRQSNRDERQHDKNQSSQIASTYSRSLRTRTIGNTQLPRVVAAIEPAS